MRLLMKKRIMTNIRNNFIDSIGNTPLIKLRAASEITKCNIYGKAEFLNTGGSVKDRAALALIKDAQEKKLISKGGTVVEGTAGNTGIGLGLLGNSLGYKTIIVMNDNQTQEKKDTLKNIRTSGFVHGRYMYVKDDSILMLINIMAGNCITRTDKLVTQQNIDK